MDRFQLRKKEDEEEREEDSFHLPVSFPGEDQFKERKTREREECVRERRQENQTTGHGLLLYSLLYSLLERKTGKECACFSMPSAQNCSALTLCEEMTEDCERVFNLTPFS